MVRLSDVLQHDVKNNISLAFFRALHVDLNVALDLALLTTGTQRFDLSLLILVLGISS